MTEEHADNAPACRRRVNWIVGAIYLGLAVSIALSIHAGHKARRLHERADVLEQRVTRELIRRQQVLLTENRLLREDLAACRRPLSPSTP